MQQFENICAQPRNLGNVVTTFLVLVITGKAFDPTFPEILPVWATSYPKVSKTKQFENVRVQPRNFGNIVTTFLILIITGKIFDITLIRKHCLHPVNYTFIHKIFPGIFRGTPCRKKFLKFDKTARNIFREVFLRRKFPPRNFPGFVEIKHLFTAVKLYFIDM